MTQRDYILRMTEEMGRAIAQLVYRREIRDYQAAHDLIDEQLKQTLGMGRHFIHSLSEETLLSMLSTAGVLNIEKCWLIALLLKAEGDLFAGEQDETQSFYSYLKACNLFLEALYDQNQEHEIDRIDEIEDLLTRLEEYELPLRTRQLLFWYFEFTQRYGKAEDVLYDILDSELSNEAPDVESREEMLLRGENFYLRLLGKHPSELERGNLSFAEANEGLARLHQAMI